MTTESPQIILETVPQQLPKTEDANPKSHHSANRKMHSRPTQKQHSSPRNRQPRASEVLKRKMPIDDFIRTYDMATLDSETKTKAEKLISDLKSLVFPEKPPSGFNIFMQQMRTKVEALKDMEFKKLKEACLEKWKILTQEEKKVLYDESYSLYSTFKSDRSKYFKKQTSLKMQLLELNGSIVPNKIKSITGFKIFRREMSKMMKERQPQMLAKQRHKDVKEKWKSLDKREKYVYILKSMMERKTMIHEWAMSKLTKKINSIAVTAK